MNLGILTFHFVPNKGAILQCYALKTLLEKKGHDVSIIDYRPKYHTVRYSALKNPFVYAKWYWKKFHKLKAIRRSLLTARSFARCLVMNFNGTDKEVDKLTNLFIEKNFRLTNRYSCLKQLQSYPPRMDAYICGSDQLWNPELLDQEFDRAYFLDFGKPETKRIAYAVSLGKQPSESELLLLKDLCKDLTAVSLRENNEAAIKAIGRDVRICIDPTLLIDEKDYRPIESNIVFNEPFIFVYGFETNSDIIAAVNMAIAKYNCRVINGSPSRIKLPREVEKIQNYDPSQFLIFIKNAECVVTNSFHGTTFSIIYKKRFITVPHSTRGDRMTEILEKLDLKCNLWGSNEFSLEEDIDYTNIYSKLHFLREQSIEYLTSVLGS